MQLNIVLHCNWTRAYNFRVCIVGWNVAILYVFCLMFVMQANQVKWLYLYCMMYIRSIASSKRCVICNRYMKMCRKNNETKKRTIKIEQWKKSWTWTKYVGKKSVLSEWHFWPDFHLWISVSSAHKIMMQ